MLMDVLFFGISFLRMSRWIESTLMEMYEGPEEDLDELLLETNGDLKGQFKDVQPCALRSTRGTRLPNLGTLMAISATRFQFGIDSSSAIMGRTHTGILITNSDPFCRSQKREVPSLLN